MSSEPLDARRLHVVTPSLGRKFSGINASMLAVFPELARRVSIAALGFHIPDGVARIGFIEFCRSRRRGTWLIWHARRNVEMLAGLLLKKILRYRLILLFTSAAQRTHSWITRFYYRRMDAIIATTTAAASALEREAVVVAHGVNTERFSPPDDRAAAWAKLGLPGCHGIGILGRVRPQKGTGEFVEAMVRVLPLRPDWTAVIVGQTTGEYRIFEQHLRGKISDAGLTKRVHFTGFLKDSSVVPDWYRALSVVICASRTEGFGLSCLEAMASGCAVVATRAGAWPELITDGEDGYLVPCNDVSALADALLKMTGDPTMASRMGVAGRNKALSRYRIQNEADGIIAVYRRLLVEKGIRL